MAESTPIEIARATRAIVAEIVATTGFEPPLRFLDRIETFAAALALWGAKLNLTATPDDPAKLAFHIIDSLAPLILAGRRGVPMLAARAAFPDAFMGSSNRTIVERSALTDAFAAGTRVLDLGSGAGFPALILAAACDADFLLMEVRRKRASFLRVTAAEMGLSNVQVDSSRAEPAALRSAHDESSRVESKTSRMVDVEPALAGNQASRTIGSESSRTDTAALPKIRTDSSRGEMEASRRVFEVVTARAFAEPAIVFETAAAVLKAGGRVILYASAAQREAIERASAARFEPPVFLPYSLTHASIEAVGKGSTVSMTLPATRGVAGGGPVIGSTGKASDPTGKASDSTGKASDSTVSIARAATRTVAGGSSSSVVGASAAGVDSGGIPGDMDRAGSVVGASAAGVDSGGIAGSSDGADSPVESGVVHMLAICHRR